MAPSYKLYYFDTIGIGEPLRFLFSYGNIEFEDIRIKHEDWPQYKSEMPFGQMPVLEYDGKKYGQNLAIARFLAKKVKLTGANDWEDLQIDGIVDTITDLRIKIIQQIHELDEDRKEKLRKVFYEETLPYYLERFETGAKANNGYLATENLSWADVYFAAIFDAIENWTKIDLLSTYPTLQALKKKVTAIPSIQKWIESRP